MSMLSEDASADWISATTRHDRARITSFLTTKMNRTRVSHYMKIANTIFTSPMVTFFSPILLPFHSVSVSCIIHKHIYDQ